MPIVVNELVFKGEIAKPAPRAEAAPTPRGTAVDRQALIEECAEQVLRILEQRSER